MYIVKNSFLSISIVFLIFSTINMKNDFIEKEMINKVITDNNITKNMILTDISKVKQKIVDMYMNPPKTKLHYDTWMESRGFLRQTTLETLSGKVGVCGELSRVMIKLIRSLDIKARRLYLYNSSSTNHVAYEFYDEVKQKWIIANSYESSKYLENYLKGKNITSQELLELADTNKLVYTQFSNIPYTIEKYIGHQYNVPYIFSYFMDEVYIFKSTLFLFISILSFILYRRIIIEKK